jgi:catechol-2,3-dioxygenase
MIEQETLRVMGVRHVGLAARDPSALADFYNDLLGLETVPVEMGRGGPAAFLSSRPDEGSIDLAFFADSALQHTAFEVASLEDLCAFHQRIIDRGVPIKFALNHGVTLSFYFEDPEGHMIEIYWPTGNATNPRHGEPLDLTKPPASLRRQLIESKMPIQ